MDWLRWWWSPLELRIDPRRINDEWRATHHDQLYQEDLVYRARVMRRMREGLSAEQLAPLIDRSQTRRRERVEAG